MQGGLKRSIRPFSSLIIFAFVLLACLLFYRSTYPIEQFEKSFLWRNEHKHDRELAKVLAKASMPNKTVILTTLNDAWAVPGSVIDLFLDSFHMGEGTQGLLKHLVIVNMDQKAFDRCKVIHNPQHCYSLTTPGVNFAAEKRFMTPEYLMLMWRRIDFLREVLELGYNFVFTDADIMWFRDPFPYFNAPDEIMIACDFYKGPPRSVVNRANGGFNYVKSTQSSVKFYKYWYKARLLHPGAHDQSVFEIIKHEEIVKKLGLRIRYLDTAYFGGFCELSRDMNKVCTMHANCCVGIERKINDLTLVLQDWKNFTMLSPEKRKLQGASSAVQWRAPDKCKWW